jgi:hypothetical protein
MMIIVRVHTDKFSPQITLNLKHFSAEESPDLFIEGSIYIVEGIVDSQHNTMHVISMWLPPPPPPITTKVELELEQDENGNLIRYLGGGNSSFYGTGAGGAGDMPKNPKRIKKFEVLERTFDAINFFGGDLTNGDRRMLQRMEQVDVLTNQVG